MFFNFSKTVLNLERERERERGGGGGGVDNHQKSDTLNFLLK